MLSHVDVALQMRPPGAAPVRRSVSGVGDTRVWVERTRPLSAGEAGASLTLGLGLRVPTGRPRRPQVAGGVPSSTLQTGSGTWDPALRVAVGIPLGRAVGFVSVEGSLPVMGNRFGYRPGVSVHIAAGLEWRVAPALALLPQLSYAYRDVDRVRGRRLFASGGHWVAAALTAELRPTEALSLWAGVTIPVARDLVTPTLEAPVRWSAGVSLRF